MNYLYSRVLETITIFNNAGPSSVNKMAHETLVLACHEGIKGSRLAYGNLFSQVDFLCRKHNVRPADRIAVQAMRCDTNGRTQLGKADFMYAMRALSRFISAVTGDDVPGELLRLLPANDKDYDRAEGLDVRYVRCIVRNRDDEYIYVSAERGLDGRLLAVDCSAEDFTYVRRLVREGMQMNLLDCKMSGMKKDGNRHNEGVRSVVVPGLIIIEPDYLVDISSIAACFKEYGHHPLNFTLERMRRKTNSTAILLGNLAGSVLDGIVNNDASFSLASAMRTDFVGKALEYCSCKDFNAARFKDDIRTQARNIHEAVSVMFADHDRSLAVLEPSFVCERLGLQGRVDLMTTDFRLLVEQKSGRNRNIENGRPSNHGSMQSEQHYVQLLLYYGVLRYNFNLGYNRLDIRLLYSKYPPKNGLVAVAFYRKLFREAIKLRNEIVATDFIIARDGFGRILPYLTENVINTEGLASSFYHTWLMPRILEVTEPLKRLPPLEHDYLCSMATFAFREQLLGKVGSQEGVSSCTADLWNMPLTEKIETGNIYSGLRITNKGCSEGGDVPDMIRLSVPGQGEGFLPNFRRGDMVYLYRYPEGQEPDARNAILYKGVMAEIHTGEITVALTNGQKNPEILKVQDKDDGTLYAVEHAGGDATAGSALRGLFEFVTAPEARKTLLLGQREPRRNAGLRLTRAYNPAYDDIIERVMQAEDYFLMSGPPGTGKTSMAIRFIVEEELTRPGASILLTAYTNRAVDELCDMLGNAGIDYIRLGSEYSAARQCKPHLLTECAKDMPRLADIKSRITAVRVITGTTSMLMSRPYIFDLKHFSLAVVDEASQILEPDIIGLLAAHRPDGLKGDTCRIDRFVLTGDHKQLPAVVRQDDQASAVTSATLRDIGLDNCRNSLFERLLRLERRSGRTAFTGVLRRHGRMHPDIASFPCHEFYYEESLSPVPLAHQKETALDYADIGLHDGLDRMLRTHRMIFIPSRPCRQPDVSDKVNTDEAAVVADILHRVRLMLGDRFSPGRSVGVIVPYRNQIAVIRKEIERYGMKELEEVSVDTVERYQGSQRDVIIYSFTVQNTWQLEFLTGSCFDEDGRTIDRKLNVAMTRARRQMIMTGNEEILSTNQVFKRLIGYVRENGGEMKIKKGLR